MEIKKNIRVGDRIRFVDFVCDICEKDGKQYYALFDYAWRIAVITFFAPEAELDKMDTDEMCDFVYSRQGVEIVEDPDIAVVTAGLYEACEAEMKDRKEKYMKVFDAINHPDPLDRIADAFAEIAGNLSQLGDQEFLADLVKKVREGEQPAKKPPVKIEVVNGKES